MDTYTPREPFSTVLMMRSKYGASEWLEYQQVKQQRYTSQQVPSRSGSSDAADSAAASVRTSTSSPASAFSMKPVDLLNESECVLGNTENIFQPAFLMANADTGVCTQSRNTLARFIVSVTCCMSHGTILTYGRTKLLP